MPRKMRDFVHFLPHCSPPRTLFDCARSFRHRTLLVSFALFITPSALRRTLPLRFIPRSSALSRAALMSGREDMQSSLPPRRRSDVRKDTQVSLPPCPAPLCTGFAHLFKRAKPLRPRRRGFSHCHVMFRVELTLEKSKQAHRRRASLLQARSQASTHSG